jgi:Zn-dependent protease
MALSLLYENPMYFLAWLAAILIGLSIHEFAHAYAAHKMGDDTAERAGRLTLNPMAHIDMMGFVALLLIGFGWGKPVPVNPYNLKYKKWGDALVSMAGPFANFLAIVVFSLILKFVGTFTAITISNLYIQFLNLLIIINIVLLTFNLIPIPPLDGSKVLFAFLSHPKYDNFKRRLESQGTIILIVFMLLDNFLHLGILDGIFSFIINLVYGIF